MKRGGGTCHSAEGKPYITDVSQQEVLTNLKKIDTAFNIISSYIIRNKQNGTGSFPC